MIDCVDYIITHKEFPIKQDEMYRTLCVGGLRKAGTLCELDGLNISKYNDRINECTGMYWMWKNTDSRYIGLSHYRRWFYNDRFPDDRSRLDADRVEEILCMQGFDMIMTRPLHFNWRIIDNFNLAVGPNLTEQARAVFRDMISWKQPEYVDAFDDAMMMHYMYICNLFVTSRKLFNEYCSWLFSFLLDAADRIDVTGFNGKQRRIAGYFAETMWMVWLRKNGNIKIREMPNVMVWD